MTIPTADDVSAAWLTDCLRAAGHDGVRVRGFEAIAHRHRPDRQVHPLHASTSRTARTARRARLVGKFPSDDPISRQTGVDLGNYRREVEFYRQLASRLTIRTPRCYYAAIEGVGPHFALLLSDAAPAEPGDQLAGCNEAVARAAVLELAGLHAPTWNDPTICGVEWISEPSAETIDRHRGWYQSLLPGFLDRYAHRLEPDSRAIIERVAASTGHPFIGRPDPFALTHVDYRLDNLLIDDRSRAAHGHGGRLAERHRRRSRSRTSPTSSAPDCCPRRGAPARRASCASTTSACSTPASPATRGPTVGRTTGAAPSPGFW